MTDVAIPSDKKEVHEKLENYQGLKEEVEKMWELKVAVVVPDIIWALRTVTPKMGESAAAEPRNNIRHFCPEEAVPGTAKILCRTLKPPGLW